MRHGNNRYGESAVIGRVGKRIKRKTEMSKNIVVCVAESDGKIRDVTFYEEYNVMALEWCKQHKDKGMTVKVIICDFPPFLTKRNEKKSDNELTRLTKPRWSIQVKCVENGKTYKTMKDCASDLGISAYRIRRVLDSNMTVDGLHFIRVLPK